MMFDCHINVEICISRVGSIKYLFKYLCKGRDRVTVELTSDDPNQRHDELQNFIDARYASASEAIWRLLGLTYIEMSPTVARLDVHLPGHQNVYFEAGQEREAAARTNNHTKLLQFFEVNRQYPNARHLTYLDLARYFSWQKGKWTPRKAFLVRRAAGGEEASTNDDGPEYNFDLENRAASTVSRIYTVSLREGERYFLRMLLFHVLGPTSFEDVRTVDGEVYNSFRDACIARGLLQDDSEWRRALQFAFRSLFVPLTEIFATLLAFCNVSDPVGLWEEFRARLVQDIRQRFRQRPQLQSTEQAEKYVLLEIENYLQSMVRKTLKDFGDFPDVELGLEVLEEAAPGVGQGGNGNESPEQLRQQVVDCVTSFNEGQKNLFDKVVGAVLPGTTADTVIQGQGQPQQQPQPPQQPGEQQQSGARGLSLIHI